MFLELHILQSFGPSVLNRDDTNTPKSAPFGGVSRARVSSQCLKRLMRDHYEAALGEASRSVISRKVPNWMGARLAGLAGRDAATSTAVAATAFAQADFDVSRAKTGSGYWMAAPSRFALADLEDAAAMLDAEFDRLAAVHAAAVAAGKKKADDPMAKIGREDTEFTRAFRAVVLRKSNLGVALFGRMITMKKVVKGDDAGDAETERTRRTDGACAVAHALSTHRSAPDFDFFTAVDDFGGGTGGAMMGSIAFNSATYYRSVVVNLGELERLLGHSDALTFSAALRGFVDAAVLLEPRAKQATFLAREAPSLVLAVVRDTHPVTLANAFERPVVAAPGGGFIEPSVAALAAHWTRQAAAWGNDGVHGVVVFSPLDDEVLGDLAAHVVRPYDGFAAAVAHLAAGGS